MVILEKTCRDCIYSKEIKPKNTQFLYNKGDFYDDRPHHLDYIHLSTKSWILMISGGLPIYAKLKIASIQPWVVMGT